MHILILSYIALSDGILTFAETARKDGHKISFFPLAIYRTNSYLLELLLNVINKRQNYSLVTYESKEEIDLCIWWYPLEHIKYDVIKSVIDDNKNIRHITYNYDLTYLENIETKEWVDRKIMKNKNSSLMSLNITVNPYEYKCSKHKNKYLCPPGYNDKYSFPADKNKDYICDVSILCTNLYDREPWISLYQRINRKKLIDLIYNDKDINFHFYGPKKFKEVYPKAYKKHIKYSDCNKVFTNSKINICVQAITIDGYLSERVPQVFASKGLVLIDNEIGYGFIKNKDYVVVDEKNPLQQIKNLLKDEDKMNEIKENGYKKRKNLTWDRLYKIVKDKN